MKIAKYPDNPQLTVRMTKTNMPKSPEETEIIHRINYTKPHHTVIDRLF